MAEQTRLRKLEEAKAALLEEVKGKASELGLSLNDVFPTRRQRKNMAKASVQPTFKGLWQRVENLSVTIAVSKA
jgi:hypothetical protein